MHIHQERKTVGLVKRYQKHYLLENNIFLLNKVQPAAFVTNTKSAILDKWHQILAYVFHKKITHLKNLVEKVRVTNRDNGQVAKTNKCEICILFKAHCIISRRPKKIESWDKLSHQVTYNLM